MKTLTVLCAIVALVGLLGCGARQLVVPDGPSEWQDGYRHGWNSLLAAIGVTGTSPSTGKPLAFTQDSARMEDARYRDGWHAGFEAAKAFVEYRQREQQLLGTMIGPIFR